jgi:hypothetical protein
MASELLTTNRKALTINLDEAKYGTFAEIGNFFKQEALPAPSRNRFRRMT